MYGFVLNEFKQPMEAEKYTSKVIALQQLTFHAPMNTDINFVIELYSTQKKVDRHKQIMFSNCTKFVFFTHQCINIL